MQLESIRSHDDPTAARLVLRRSLFGRRRYVAERPWRRRNDLYPALGLLELSNALDFAANLWNAIPPPLIAMVFMALGATGALVILFFASLDYPRAWRNTSILRAERNSLTELGKDRTRSGLSQRDLQTYIDINHRELGNETVDRLIMLVLLGFGALTVGIGTYMAMDGANPTVYLASNIITGYVGNCPAACYGLMNAAWCFYGWRRAHRHSKGTRRRLACNPWSSHSVDIADEIHAHGSRVKHHATINGISGILGGAGSLMTASTYIYPVGAWGYIILIVCVISAVYVNLYWRWRVNCDRDVLQPTPLNEQDLLNDLGQAVLRKQLLRKYCHNHWISEFFSWQWHQSDRKLGGDGLRKFLLDWHLLTADWLTHQEARLSEKSAAVTVDEKAKESPSPPSDDPCLQLTTIRTQLSSTNNLLSTLRSPMSDPNHHATNQDLASILYTLLVSADLFPDLCAHLANSSHTCQVLNVAPASNSEKQQDSERPRQKSLSLDSEQIWPRLSAEIECSPCFLDEFLVIAQMTLSVEGMRAVRSRVREGCERVGCYMSLSP